MGLISNIVESVIVESIIKGGSEANQKNKGCYRALLVMIGTLIVLFFVFIIWIIASIGDHEREVWDKVNVGDSLFVESSYGIYFYKKGRIELTDREQREIKYAREDTIDFEWANRVPDKYFFKNKTSFLGVCIGLDSTLTSSGDKWLMVHPAYGITHPPDPKDRFDYDTRKWEDKRENFYGYKLSKEFYLKPSDVTLINNDQEFK